VTAGTFVFNRGEIWLSNQAPLWGRVTAPGQSDRNSQRDPMLPNGLLGLRKNCWIAPDIRRTVPAPDFLAAASISPGERVFKPARTLYLATTGLLAAASISPGENGPELSKLAHAPISSHALMFCIRAQLKPCPSFSGFFRSLFSRAGKGELGFGGRVRAFLSEFSPGGTAESSPGR
jgi:hypothetical protein